MENKKLVIEIPFGMATAGMSIRVEPEGTRVGSVETLSLSASTAEPKCAVLVQTRNPETAKLLQDAGVCVVIPDGASL